MPSCPVMGLGDATDSAASLRASTRALHEATALVPHVLQFNSAAPEACMECITPRLFKLRTRIHIASPSPSSALDRRSALSGTGAIPVRRACTRHDGAASPSRISWPCLFPWPSSRPYKGANDAPLPANCLPDASSARARQPDSETCDDVLHLLRERDVPQVSARPRPRRVVRPCKNSSHSPERSPRLKTGAITSGSAW